MLQHYTDDELDELFKAERELMVSAARSAHFWQGKERRNCFAEHDRAESICLAILDEMKVRVVCRAEQERLMAEFNKLVAG
jgi:hypothetical protein